MNITKYKNYKIKMVKTAAILLFYMLALESFRIKHLVRYPYSNTLPVLNFTV
jgi:hypothetical protein